MIPSYRTLWISDLHLGTKASRANELLDFLTEANAARIYLVGDIIDLQRMRSRPMFPNAHMRVIAELAQLVKHGTEVIYIPGNHDFEFRRLVGSEIAGIPVMLEASHVTPTGQELLVMHGDVLDGRIRNGTNLEKFGATAYFLLSEADVLYNRLRERLGHDYLPVGTAIKRRLKSAQEYIERYEIAAADYARERGFDGVVCGHIHKPCIRHIGGVVYANDGDWVEHRTALAESIDGTLQILNWQFDTVQAAAPGTALAPAA